MIYLRISNFFCCPFKDISDILFLKVMHNSGPFLGITIVAVEQCFHRLSSGIVHPKSKADHFSDTAHNLNFK